jgi:hypothetical protein
MGRSRRAFGWKPSALTAARPCCHARAKGTKRRGTIFCAGDRKPVFSPLDHAWIKAIACERVAETGLPVSRQSLEDLKCRAEPRLGRPISRSTICRILQSDAIKPWQHQS